MQVDFLKEENQGKFRLRREVNNYVKSDSNENRNKRHKIYYD